MVFNQDNQNFLLRATKSHGIQLRLSIDIQQSADHFNGFFCMMNFVGLFS